MIAGGLPAQRITLLNKAPEKKADGQWIIYWMSASQRVESNPALEYAVSKSNEHARPLIVLFCLDDKYPEAYERHYAFMLEGLALVAASLRLRGIKFAVVQGAAPGPVLAAARRASCVVTDCGYTRLFRRWCTGLAERAPVAVFQVEGDVVVPAKLLMDRRDDCAATFRPRLTRWVNDFLVDVTQQPVRFPSLTLALPEVFDSSDTVFYDVEAGVDTVLEALDLNRSVPRACAGGGGDGEALRGGTREALRHLERFLGAMPTTRSPMGTEGGGEGGPPNYLPARSETRGIASYAERRNDASARKQSQLSPYLHFGQLSVIAVALAARALLAAHPHLQADVNVFWEELVVRREFAVHFVLQHADDYDSHACLPAWATSGAGERVCVCVGGGGGKGAGER
jgi:deoxyribodipyrimidine photo-lyase